MSFNALVYSDSSITARRIVLGVSLDWERTVGDCFITLALAFSRQISVALILGSNTHKV